jgi:translation initiation factor IF-2
MSEQETVKVYELAKELGIDSISLLDKLKGLNINVKNHMSDLASEEARMARASLLKPVASSDKPTKKAAPRTRKKPAAEASAGETKTSTRATTAKTTTKTTRTAAASATPASAQEPASGARAASPIIRRRTKADGATETVTQSAPGTVIRRSSSDTAEHAEQDETQNYESTPSEYTEQSETTDYAEPEAPAAMTSSQEGEVSDETAAAQGTPATSGGSPSLNLGSTGAPATSTPTPARPPVVLTPRPVAPRRSILRIVEPSALPAKPRVMPVITPGQKAGAIKGASTTDKEGFRITKISKENIDAMVEEEAAKKRGGGREVEIRPEDVRFADYRKKEMVFLPKKKRLPIGKEIKKTQVTQAKAQKRVVEMTDNITVQDLANQLSVKSVDVVRKLMGMGVMASIHQTLDFDTATLIATEYQYEVKNVAFKEEELIGAAAPEDKADDLQPRPPVVTIMGHVDHGKTTLLDSIREANVAGGEAGGITQHIGAYTVEKNGKMITFIDTPGHEAFSVMRARGANVTDIVILVVSADDGVMPQTREAISHAQAAKVPIIVAVNKIDKPGANPEKIKQGLAELNLLAEDWGGDVAFVPVSALKKTNLDKLLDAILLQAEVMELKGNPNTLASGTVLEARLERGRGPVVSLLVARGTLKVGDAIVAGPFAGKVKALTDDKGRSLKTVGPAFAAEVLGFEGLPSAGEKFNGAPTEADARDIASNREDKNRAKIAGAQGKMSLEELFSKVQSGDVKELNVVLKADVFGSMEAIRESLVKASTDKVKVKVIHSAPGGITESDILLASASGAIVIGFNVRPETKARQLAEAEHVEVKTYQIIYELIDDVRLAMTGLLDKKKVEKFLGRAEVRQTFSVPKIGVIAGSAVIDGKIIRGANVRLLRDSRIIFEGKMSSLRRFKDDAKEVASGFECGIGIENYNDLKPGDIIEAFQIDMVAPTLEEASKA